jgi:chorismate mutase
VRYVALHHAHPLAVQIGLERQLRLMLYKTHCLQPTESVVHAQLHAACVQLERMYRCEPQA